MSQSVFQKSKVPAPYSGAKAWGQTKVSHTPTGVMRVPTIEPQIPKFDPNSSINPYTGKAYDTDLSTLEDRGMDVGSADYDWAAQNEAGSALGGGNDWLDYGSFGLGVAKVGLGVYNALEQSKMNDFMRDYYGDLMDIQKADFSNAAKSTNEELQARQERRLDARGIAAGSDESTQQLAAYADRWGVQETI